MSRRIAISSRWAISGLSQLKISTTWQWAFGFELLCPRVGWENTKLPQQHRPGISNRVLHARWKDQDIPGAVSLRAVLGSTLALAGKNNDHFFGYVRMPGNDNARAYHVLIDRRSFGAEALVGDEVSHTRLRSVRRSHEHLSQDQHLVQSTLMFAALMTGHHLPISAA
jgi:hypothetical protein